MLAWTDDRTSVRRSANFKKEKTFEVFQIMGFQINTHTTTNINFNKILCYLRHSIPEYPFEPGESHHLVWSQFFSVPWQEWFAPSRRSMSQPDQVQCRSLSQGCPVVLAFYVGSLHTLESTCEHVITYKYLNSVKIYQTVAPAFLEKGN